MKIIDEKGKVFGKVNIIDLFVFLLVLSLIPLFIMSKNLSGKNSNTIYSKVRADIQNEERAKFQAEIAPQREELTNAISNFKKFKEDEIKKIEDLKEWKRGYAEGYKEGYSNGKLP